MIADGYMNHELLNTEVVSYKEIILVITSIKGQV